MRKFLGLSLTIALGLTSLITVPAVADSDNGRTDIGDEAIVANVGSLAFATASEVKTYRVTIPAGPGGAGRNGSLTVETQDFLGCTDHWGVRIVKHDGQLMADAVGDGSATVDPSVPDVDEWSGAAAIPALPRKDVTVAVYYDDGCNVFPARMWVRFTFHGEVIDVTPTL